MTQELIEDTEDEAPVRPFTRTKGLLDGLVTCDDCGEQLVGVLDATGRGFYVHEHEVEG